MGNKRIILREVGANRLQVLKVLRTLLKIELNQIKTLVEKLPIVLKEGLDQEEAVSWINALSETGAIALVESNQVQIEAMYNLDVYQEAVQEDVINTLKQKVPYDVPIRSIHILRCQGCYWPDLCLWVDDKKNITEMELNPSRKNCAIPPNTDEDDAVFDYLVEKFPEIDSKEFELFNVNALMYKLLSSSRLAISQNVLDFVKSLPFDVMEGFVVLFEEADDFSLRDKKMTKSDFYHEALIDDINRLFDSREKLNLFSEVCYQNEPARKWLTGLKT